jgi:putative DNA methylase
MRKDDAPTTYPIDAEFDADFANRIARLETYNKHYYRPNSYLHKWWARRCGSTFRLILKHLVDDPARRDYYAPGGLEGKVILDPMMGGGTTLHEAIRLGANVLGVDIDPIPVLQARATLSELPLHELEQAYKQFHRALRQALDPYFTTTCPHCAVATPAWFTLYGAQRHCRCGSALVVDSLVLRQEADGSCIRLCPDCHAVLADGETHRCAQTAAPPLVEKETAVCPACGQPYQDDLAVPYYARYVPLVVAGHCRAHKLFFKAVDAGDRAALRRADERRAALPFDRADFAIQPGRKSVQLTARGVDNYLDLFSSRQLLYLAEAAALLPRFAPLVRLNLALLVSTSLEFNALLCGYKGKQARRAGAIRHTFSHHAYSFPHTALENNPLYHRQASGTLHKLFQARLRNGRRWAQQPRERRLTDAKPLFVPIAGEVDAGREAQEAAELSAGTRRFWLRQGSATRLDLPDASVDFIVTDPPYYDSVQYSDLAAFFRVWLRRLLPDGADWDYDAADSAVDPHKNDRASRYTELLSGIFGECRRVLRENGRLIFTFHHWNPKAWAALTIALKQAGFVLLNYSVVHSEHPVSVHINNMNALTHDAILVLGVEGKSGGGNGRWGFGRGLARSLWGIVRGWWGGC